MIPKTFFVSLFCIPVVIVGDKSGQNAHRESTTEYKSLRCARVSAFVDEEKHSDKGAGFVRFSLQQDFSQLYLNRHELVAVAKSERLFC